MLPSNMLHLGLFYCLNAVRLEIAIDEEPYVDNAVDFLLAWQYDVEGTTPLDVPQAITLNSFMRAV